MRRAEQNGEPFARLLAEWIEQNYPQRGFQDDNWYVKEVPLTSCYFAHTDFRGFFPCSSQIYSPWLGPMPEPLAQERGHERYYILDGQMRVMRHWYHEVPNVRVFAYEGTGEV
jgi:hypothetical protein